jgi:hypothetical protein
LQAFVAVERNVAGLLSKYSGKLDGRTDITLVWKQLLITMTYFELHTLL